MKTKIANHTVKILAATAFLLTFANQTGAADPVGQECTEICVYNSVTRTYSFIKKCRPLDPPSSCPGGGSGSGSGSSGSGNNGGGAGIGLPKGLLNKLCPTCGTGNGGGGQDEECCENDKNGGESDGEEKKCCPEEGAMAHWWVSEPLVKLFLHDKPLWYETSRGQEIAFKLSFKNEPATNAVIDTRQTTIFSVGTNWHTPWRSYVQQSPNGTNYYLFLGDGSAVEHVPGHMDRHSGAYYDFDGTNHFFTFNGGVRKVYAPTLSNATNTTLWFLSRVEYPQGLTNRFQYTVTNGTVRLTKVIDSDNRETTFQYTNSGYYSHLISKVTGPSGQTTMLTYTNGQLISIKDMLTPTPIESKMEYTNGVISKLITPYGTNFFTYYSGTGWNGLRVSENAVRTNFFLYGDGPTNLFPNATTDFNSLKSQLLDGGITESLEYENLHYRNSYFWGARQYANLSSTIRGKLDDGTFQLSDLTASEFNKGRTRHWLAVAIYGDAFARPAGTTLSLERQPSPNSDGSTEGLTIWYDYANKWDNDRGLEGNPKGHTLKAWKLSSADWRILKYDRATNNRIILKKFNYGESAAVQWRTITNTYAENGVDLVATSGAGPESFTRGFNDFHQVLNQTNAMQEVTSYTYDNLHRLTDIGYPNGLITSYTYDGNGNVATQIDHTDTTNLRTNSYTWTNGLVYTHTDERGLTVTNTYDGLNRLIKTAYPDGTYITNVYTNLDLVRVVDRMGFTNGYAYNSFGQVIRHTNANQKVTIYGYCDCGTLESVTDPLGNRTEYTFDNAGRMTRITYPGNSGYTDFAYDLAGRLTTQTDGSGVSVINYYTISGLPYTASNAFGRVFLQIYDDDDRVSVSIDQNGITNSYCYDDRGRLLRSTNSVTPGGPGDFIIVQDTYEYATNITGPVAFQRESLQWSPGFDTNSVTPLAERVEYAYDLLGRKTNEVHVDVGGTPLLTNKFTFNSAGDLLTLTDGKNQTTTWKYDQYGRVTDKIDHLGSNMFLYGYDANGRLTSRWTPAKTNTFYSYDRAGNLTNINYDTSTDIRLTYDDLNRVSTMVDAVGTTRYSYTAFGALATEDGPWANDTVSYTYDNRRRSGLSVEAPNAAAWSQSYTYDAANRLKTVSSPAGTFTYDYHTGLSGSSPANLVRKLTLPNTAAITNNYDIEGRMLGTWLRNSSGSVLDKSEYTYNNLDQRTQLVRTGGDYVDYAYDALGQLKTAFGKETGGSTNRWHEQFTYAYDAAGNLTNRVQHTLTNSFSVNSLNQLSGGSRSGNMTAAGTVTSNATSVTLAINGGAAANAIRYEDETFVRTNLSLANGTNMFTAVASDGVRNDTNTSVAYLPSAPTFVYDSNGNLTFDGQKSYEWDDENQLIWLTATNSWRSQFIYDGKMRRRVRREFTWQTGTWVLTNEVRYIYDGNLDIQQRSTFNVPTLTLTRGYDVSGTFQGAGGVGGLLAFSRHSMLTTEHTYYHADIGGNITALADAGQKMVARYIYSPSGEMVSMAGSLAGDNVYRFSSKESDARSGFLYYLYRYYIPNLQRWLNRDPAEERGEQNLYRALRNAAPLFVDDFGLREIIISHWPEPGEGAYECAKRIAAEVLNIKFPNDKSSRYNHCLASCRIKKECAGGRFTSWLAGDWSQDPWFKSGDTTNSDPGDRAANKVGRKCPKKDKCEDHCQNAFKRGLLYPTPEPRAFIDEFFDNFPPMGSLWNSPLAR